MNRIETPWPNVLVLRGPIDHPEKRVREWILSRCALHMLARARHSSLSHSGDYAAAMIGDVPVGVDVQVVRPLSERAGHLFLSDEEQSDLERCTIEHRILHFFCAKEAAWKAHGGAIPTLKQIPLKLKEETITGLLFDAAATYATGEIIVAVTTTS
ncbi:MAG TPA: 4'-phosphopantetheinyl transferase superfamily protein [Thermoanaerobaculia bacterium]|jgi:phosphopantetheinyl transferase|nr:4'-phosphopantetheinyl transferase superfamily protein [Thermoanaerobaculia bacterium]